MKKKYIIPISTYIQVTKYAGDIECDSFEEYEDILDDRFEEFLESGDIAPNISNDFEVSSNLTLDEYTKEDIEFYKRSDKI